ncbi:MAG: hypothetical protein WBM98_14810, partial [Maribacter sp.]|uniref:hypothetical protein n=1 Tax=Maribacter sp. TaxID=1897614 RepID=UPI003C775ECC
TIDHPYMGQAHASKLLLSLEDRLPKYDLQELEKQSVGPSFKSYYRNGHLYALPIDAAALVAVSRNDVLARLNLTLPGTRTELFRFYKKVPDGYATAWPLCPTDLWCSFLTLCAQDGGRDFICDRSIDEKIGSSVLNEIKEHLKYLHPESLNRNPIQILDRMATEDEIIYSPYLFGYTNYSREGFAKNMVSFSNSPVNPKNNVSTILGGVGLAVSAKCEYVDEAVAYVYYVAEAKTQETIYTENGGQPGNLFAWQSEANNKLCNNFFIDTLQTMEKAYVRPQHVGWNKFQELGADLLHKGLVRDIASDTLMGDLNQLYKSFV